MPEIGWFRAAAHGALPPEGVHNRHLHQACATFSANMATRRKEADSMTTFPALETYRAELQAMDYRQLDDAALAEVRRRYAASRHSSAIEGIHPSPEQEAFFDMLHDMRVPQDLANEYSDRFLQERIVGPALARQAERESVRTRA